MATLPDPVPNDWDTVAQLTTLTEAVNQIIEYLADKEVQGSKNA